MYTPRGNFKKIMYLWCTSNSCTLPKKIEGDLKNLKLSRDLCKAALQLRALLVSYLLTQTNKQKINFMHLFLIKAYFCIMCIKKEVDNA